VQFACWSEAQPKTAHAMLTAVNGYSVSINRLVVNRGNCPAPRVGLGEAEYAWRDTTKMPSTVALQHQLNAWFQPGSADGAITPTATRLSLALAYE